MLKAFNIKHKNKPQKNYIQKLLESARPLIYAGISYPHSIAFCWGLLIVAAEKRKAVEILYSDAR
jgi:hypothetical protein